MKEASEVFEIEEVPAGFVIGEFIPTLKKVFKKVTGTKAVIRAKISKLGDIYDLFADLSKRVEYLEYSYFHLAQKVVNNKPISEKERAKLKVMIEARKMAIKNGTEISIVDDDDFEVNVKKMIDRNNEINLVVKKHKINLSVNKSKKK